MVLSIGRFSLLEQLQEFLSRDGFNTILESWITLHIPQSLQACLLADLKCPCTSTSTVLNTWRDLCQVGLRKDSSTSAISSSFWHGGKCLILQPVPKCCRLVESQWCCEEGAREIVGKLEMDASTKTYGLNAWRKLCLVGLRKYSCHSATSSSF